MKKLVVLLLAAVLAGCATVNYQAYEGKNNLHEGQGGSKVVADGVDFWANGAPPRKYTIIGVAEAEVGEGWGDNDILRSAVASEVKKQGGHAAIQMASESSFGGVMPIGGMMHALNNKKVRYQIIKYVD